CARSGYYGMDYW
nr:immunoglobulin heavy chain junction region [Mus musculus]